MAKLTRQHQIIIIQRLVCYETAQEIIEAVKEEFGLDVSRQQNALTISSVSPPDSAVIF